MSKDHQCRNCGSKDLYQAEVNTQTSHLLEAVTNYRKGGAVKFQVRVCGDCGLYEWFVAPEHLADVKQRLKRLV